MSQVVFRFFSYDFYVIIESCQMQFYILIYIKYYLIFKSELCVNITWIHMGAPAFSGKAYGILQHQTLSFTTTFNLHNIISITERHVLPEYIGFCDSDCFFFFFLSPLLISFRAFPYIFQSSTLICFFFQI